MEDLDKRINALEKFVEQQIITTNDLKQMLEKNTKLLEELKSPSAAVVSKEPNEFELLKQLVLAPEWPNAVDPALICNTKSEQDKEDRAEGILDLIIDVHLENLKFLDFGCGEGHVAMKATQQKPKISVGYDNKANDWDKWKDKPNLIMTTDWGKVKEQAPYNVILLYDVLDHISGNNADIIETLRSIRHITAPNAKVYVRTHPWISRHASHLYHELNKAYAHLVFDEEELKQMGYNYLYTRPVIHPIDTYSNWFKISGFQSQRDPQIIREPVEPFFVQNELVKKRIQAHYKVSPDGNLKSGTSFPIFQMEQQFLDYVLL